MDTLLALSLYFYLGFFITKVIILPFFVQDVMCPDTPLGKGFVLLCWPLFLGGFVVICILELFCLIIKTIGKLL